ncbi:MAG: hypothetical protein EA355_09825 [Rhodobacteraceae bacterium]|nr:MAG: hypothetical protein EA355_09825 [Paracoccaceae bacterium]
MSKYEPLNRLLATTSKGRLTLAFETIERIIGGALPPSASRHAAWWANNPEGHSHSRAWIRAGWRTENLDLAGRKVDFVRAPRPHGAEAAPGAAQVDMARDPWGALAGTVAVKDPCALTEPTGARWAADSGPA